MFAILLDTCALLWLGFGNRSLSLNARQIIEETDTDSTWMCPTNAAHRFFKVKVEMMP